MKLQLRMCYRSSLMAAILFSGLALPAAAQDHKGVEVQVWSIRATNKNDYVSPELKSLVKTLKKTFKFKGYKLVKTETRGLKDKAETWTLPASYKMMVTLKEKSNEKIKLKCEVTRRENNKDKKKLSTTIAVKPGKFQLFGGWKLEGDDVLIIALSAK